MITEQQIADQILKDFSPENFDYLEFHSFFSGCLSITYTGPDGRSYCIGFYKALGDAGEALSWVEAFSPHVETFEKQSPHRWDCFWYAKVRNDGKSIEIEDRSLVQKLRNRLYSLYKINQKQTKEKEIDITLEIFGPVLQLT